MFPLTTQARQAVSFVTLLAIPVLIFIGALAVKIPSSLNGIFQVFSTFPLLLLLALFYLAFRLPKKWGWLAGLALTMLLFGLTLSSYWNSGFSNNKVIAGFLPYKDGESYYQGAEMILQGRPIPADGMQADGRPLFPGLLASLLFLTGHNLLWSLAMLVGVMGVLCYCSARRIFDSWGAAAAALYTVLLYFYIQHLISTTLSELPGLAFGCLSLILLWRAAQTLNLRDMICGLAMLMLGVSIRAGAFFIFPLSIFWAGWAWRGEKRFSYRAAAVATLTIVSAFLVLNVIYPRLVVATGDTTFGNLAYAVYGQVLGGAGWHRAIVDLQTRDAMTVYRAAFDFFSKHPLSLLIGVAKSYRDFLMPGPDSIFGFTALESIPGLGVLLWLAALGLTAGGMIQSIRQARSALPALLLVVFCGIFLSIPFLPPIDGGNRFYASSIPFFFALPAFALGNLSKKPEADGEAELTAATWPAAAGLIFMVVVIMPVLIQRMSRPTVVHIPACPAKQVSFAIKASPASYVDLVPDQSTTACGIAPEICLEDFKANGADKAIDGFYQKLDSEAEASSSTSRIYPTVDLIGEGFHFFLGSPEQIPANSTGQLVLGCATEMRAASQSIYRVNTVVTP